MNSWMLVLRIYKFLIRGAACKEPAGFWLIDIF